MARLQKLSATPCTFCLERLENRQIMLLGLSLARRLWTTMLKSFAATATKRELHSVSHGLVRMLDRPSSVILVVSGFLTTLPMAIRSMSRRDWSRSTSNLALAFV